MASYEGKTLDVVCGMCEEGHPTHKCGDWQENMCSRCVKQHQKLAATEHHVILELNEKSSQRSISPEAPYCNKHTNQVLISLCKTCITSLCITCKADHIGHEMIQTRIDARLLQKMNSQKIPEFIDIFNTLQEMESGSNTVKELYLSIKQAVLESRQHLTGLIQTESKRILDDIQHKIDNATTISTDHPIGLNEYITETDQHLAEIDTVRYETDINNLMYRLNMSDKAIQETKKFIAKFKNTSLTHNVDSVLPHIGELDNLESMIRKYYTFKKPVLKAETTSLMRSSALDITDDRDKSTRPYKLMKKIGEMICGETFSCKISETLSSHHTVLFYGRNKSSQKDINIYIFDVEAQSLTKDGIIEGEIWKMATLTQNKHIIIKNHESFQLLNAKYDIVFTLKREPGKENFKPWNLCLFGQDTVVVAEYRYGHQITRFSKVRVEDNKLYRTHLCEVNVEVWPAGMSLCPDRQHITIQNYQWKLCRLNIYTGEIVQSCHCPSFARLLQDGESTIIGDFTGNLHLVKDGQYNGVIIKTGSNRCVLSIAVRRGKLVVVVYDTGSDDNETTKIIVYG